MLPVLVHSSRVLIFCKSPIRRLYPLRPVILHWQKLKLPLLSEHISERPHSSEKQLRTTEALPKSLTCLLTLFRHCSRQSRVRKHPGPLLKRPQSQFRFSLTAALAYALPRNLSWESSARHCPQPVLQKVAIRQCACEDGQRSAPLHWLSVLDAVKTIELASGCCFPARRSPNGAQTCKSNCANSD